MQPTTVLVPGEREALAEPGFDRLALGAVGAALAAAVDPATSVRLARYEQFTGRETEADARLAGVLTAPGTPAEVAREAESLRRLGIAFEPAFGELDWAGAALPRERDSVGIRERVSIAFARLVADGREPAHGWADDHRAGDWDGQRAIVDDAATALLELLASEDLDELLRAIDLCVWVPMIQLAHADHQGVVTVVAASRAAHARTGLRVLEVFFDYLEGIVRVAMLDLAEGKRLLDLAVEGFAEASDRRWWMLGKAAQALVAVLTHEQLPPDLDELERMLVSGSWRRGRRSLGQATLMLMAIVFASSGDLEGAKRVALADGGLDELVVPATDRIVVIEAVGHVALAEGDLETCAQMLRIADHMMASPIVVAGRERLRAAFEARRLAGPLPSSAAEETAGRSAPEPDATLEQLRTRWMLLAQAVELGERDAAFNALAEFDAFAARARAAAVRQRAVRLFHARTAESVELSARQLEVASLAAAGLTNREIAARLFLGVRTVEGYVAGALRALGLTRRSELAGAALPMRLDAPGPGPGPVAAREATQAVVAPVLLPLRQGQVAALIAAGASNADIAAALGITEKTVDKHIVAVKERLGTSTRTGIAAAFTS
ncbi:helix-turn-helix transcriptional regulator [Agromyces lapidis]|uniref:LuxR C-terminal-related transcriptional regulator n=1 Tax=Agromyces lapidis TaxID=279574 RepID=A0ABV5STX6_9MICO|nr:helix-turn-helix transcriptional regulator [Agromyces lapidis]